MSSSESDDATSSFEGTRGYSRRGGFRPVAIGETLAVTASVGAPVPHAKGSVYEFVTEVRSGDELVWEETSAYLRRGKGSEGASYGMVFPEAAPTEAGRTVAGRSGWPTVPRHSARRAAVSSLADRAKGSRSKGGRILAGPPRPSPRPAGRP